MSPEEIISGEITAWSGDSSRAFAFFMCYVFSKITFSTTKKNKEKAGEVKIAKPKIIEII